MAWWVIALFVGFGYLFIEFPLQCLFGFSCDGSHAALQLHQGLDQGAEFCVVPILFHPDL